MEKMYTERHGLRSSPERTCTISKDVYAVLVDCCGRYMDNLAWRFPKFCDDIGKIIAGVDSDMLCRALKIEIPHLHYNRYGVVAPAEGEYYDQSALLDYIEYIAHNIRGITKNHHEYLRHDHLFFAEERASKTLSCLKSFQSDINNLFDNSGLLYKLTDSKIIERVDEYGILTEEVATVVLGVPEEGTKKLLTEAINYHRDKKPESRKIAVEKIWDAFERLKTYYADDKAADTKKEKKKSADRIVKDMGGGDTEFAKLFDTEFRALTDIGNNFRIRHHEKGKIDITDDCHYDYFFNRCLSLIALAVQYLKPAH